MRQKDVNAELVSFPGRTYADLFNQYSEKTSDKRAGISGSLNYSGIKRIGSAAVAGLIMCCLKIWVLLRRQHIRN